MKLKLSLIAFILSLTIWAQDEQNSEAVKQELWLNLPVKDLVKSKAFFTSLGFEELRDAPEMIGFQIGGVPVMMVAESEFEKYTASKVFNSKNGSEILISINAPDKKYVDKMVKKVKEAGGEIFSAPAEIQGWMYSMGFSDPDDHRWEIVHLDWESMPEE